MTASKGHILIAEDEKPVSKALALKLEHEGYTTTVVENGSDAVQKIRTEKFDCIVLDLMMPVMDGFEVLQELQELHSEVPVLVASNLAQAEDIERAKKLGAENYYVKSDTPLTQVVSQVQAMIK